MGEGKGSVRPMRGSSSCRSTVSRHAPAGRHRRRERPEPRPRAPRRRRRRVDRRRRDDQPAPLVGGDAPQAPARGARVRDARVGVEEQQHLGQEGVVQVGEAGAAARRGCYCARGCGGVLRAKRRVGKEVVRESAAQRAEGTAQSYHRCCNEDCDHERTLTRREGLEMSL